MAAGGATGDRFRARTGALSLLFATTSMDRDRLLEMLEASLAGISPPLPDDEELEAYEEESRPELDEDDLALAEVLDPDIHAPLQLTEKGEEVLFVTGSVERWLRRCPQGPLELGLASARAVAPMVLAWSATLTHALAQGPLGMTELEQALGALLDPETIEQRLNALVNSGQAEALFGSGRAPSYALTDWGREAISPIVAAVRFELRYPEGDTAPPDVFDVEAAFQMALPLIHVPNGLHGTCRAGVRVIDEEEDEELVAGSTVEVKDGRVAASSPLLDRVPETWATGTALEWSETVIEPRAAGLDMGGDVALADGLVQALHEALFGGGAPGPARLRLR